MTDRDLEATRERFANQRTNQAAVTVRHSEHREGLAVVNELDRSVSEIVSILRHLRGAGLGAAIAGLEGPWELLHDSLVRAYGRLHQGDEVSTERDGLAEEVRGARRVVDAYEGARWRLDIQEESLPALITKLVLAANNHKREAERGQASQDRTSAELREVAAQFQWDRDYIEALEEELEAAAGRKLGTTGPARMKRKARAYADHLQELRASTAQASDLDED